MGQLRKHEFVRSGVPITAYEVDGDLVFPTEHSRQTVELSRDVLHASMDVLLLNWVADLKRFRDLNRAQA